MAVLEASASDGPDGPVVVLSGEADTTTAAALRELLAAQLEGGTQLVTIDASGLSFMDSASLRVLILAARELHGRHGALILARPQPLVARMLEITGADKLLDVQESLAPAYGLDDPALPAVTSHHGCRASRSGAPGCRLPRPPPAQTDLVPGHDPHPAREVGTDARRRLPRQDDYRPASGDSARRA